ncbi:MAG: AI-2E family transporter [Clostridia bacterium]|nr:AI-2E family transporter [Clostridia bacterium]
MDLNSKNIKKILLIVFVSAVIFFSIGNIAGVWGFITKIFSFFSPVITALCIAFVLNVLLVPLETKVFKFMDNRKKKFVAKLKRPLCLILTYLIALGILSTVILVIIPDIIETITYLAEKLPAFVVKAQEWIENLLQKFNISQPDLPEIKINWSATAKLLTDWLQGSSSKIFGDAVNITASVFTGVFDTIFSIVISVYVLAQKEKIGGFLKHMLNAFLSNDITKVIYHIAHKTASSFSRFIGGQLLESLILGTLCFIGMSIFSIPNSLIISVLVCITSLVPIIGPTVGAVIGFLLIVITSPLKALLFIIFFLILQQVEGNLIYPKVVGKAVGLPGVIVVSSVMVGGNIGGVLGALIGVPTGAVIYSLLKELIIYCNNKKQNISVE